MAQAGRAAEGYAEASDPAEAFAFLTAGLDARGAPVSVSDLLPLLVAHRQKAPRDPRLYYCEGLWEISRDNYAAAAKALSTAEQNAGNDDDLRQQAREKRRGAVYRQGRVAEAYHSAGRGKDAAFRELAWLCKRDENWSALAELLALHRQEQAEDPWLGYFTALREQALGRSELALAAVQRAESAADESLRYLLASLKDELTIESGGVTQAYLNGNDRREAFRRLAPRLADVNDWAGLLKLTELHSATSSQRRSSGLYWATQAHFHRGEYQPIVDSLTPWPSDRLSRLERTQVEELWDLLVRSQLRLGKLDAAQTAANQARDDNGLELPLVAVAVAKKDQVALSDLLGQRRLAKVLSERQLHDDPELSPLLTNPELAQIRRKTGLAWPADEGRRNLSLVFFFPAPVNFAQLKTIAAGAIPSDKAVYEVRSPGRQSAVWQFDSAALVLTWAEGSYCDRAAIPKTLRPNDPCRAILEQHAGWAALDLLQGDLAGPQNAELERAHRALATALADLGAQAIYVLPVNSPNRLVLLDGPATSQIKSGEFFRSQPRRWSSSEFWLVASSDADRATPSGSLLRRELWQLADRARVANPAGQALVRIRLARGHAREDQWLKVIRSRGGPDRNEDFLAEMTAESQLWPHLRPGERLNLNLYEPLEVRPVE
jgi:hypothetical protein